MLNIGQWFYNQDFHNLSWKKGILPFLQDFPICHSLLHVTQREFTSCQTVSHLETLIGPIIPWGGIQWPLWTPARSVSHWIPLHQLMSTGLWPGEVNYKKYNLENRTNRKYTVGNNVPIVYLKFPICDCPIRDWGFVLWLWFAWLRNPQSPIGYIIPKWRCGIPNWL